MINELTDVRCPCGDEYPADSYDAGFIAGSGMCQNCDAALPPKDICTCPSGDGSLRHPCPAHPAVEQAGGDERAAFELFVRKHCGMPAHIAVNWDAKFTNDAWAGWQARAALAQPSLMPPDRGPWHAVKWDGGRRVDLSSDDFEHDVALTVSGDFVEGDKFRYAQELAAWMNAHLAQPSPARAEQAEAERPEVVARVVHSNPVVLDQCGPLNANDELMTVAQHAASVARWAEMFNRVEQERDAALAKVAELTATRNRYGVDAHYFNKNLQRILRDFESFTPDELARSLIILAKVADEKVVAQAQHSVPEEFIGRLSEFLAQRGATGKALLRELRDMLAAAPGKAQPEETPEEILAAKLIETWVAKHGKPAPWSKIVEITALATNMPNDERDRLLALDDDVDAQAQHSVPEGWMLVPVEPLLNMMSDKDHDTRITAERQLLSILAAAPGKEVGHE